MIFRIILSTLGRFQSALVECEGFEDTLTRVQRDVPQWAEESIESIFADAWALPISDKTLGALQAEFDAMGSDAELSRAGSEELTISPESEDPVSLRSALEEVGGGSHCQLCA